mmetsp:Transcript_28616/g.57249  ORF Transcript_28616/g.57249 Transcript_28616/m.57249 type:complete len:263 (-) Transcript_28616:745-1533(-)
MQVGRARDVGASNPHEPAEVPCSLSLDLLPSRPRVASPVHGAALVEVAGHALGLGLGLPLVPRGSNLRDVPAAVAAPDAVPSHTRRPTDALAPPCADAVDIERSKASLVGRRHGPRVPRRHARDNSFFVVLRAGSGRLGPQQRGGRPGCSPLGRLGFFNYGRRSALGRTWWGRDVVLVRVRRGAFTQDFVNDPLFLGVLPDGGERVPKYSRWKLKFMLFHHGLHKVHLEYVGDRWSLRAVVREAQLHHLLEVGVGRVVVWYF